MSANIVVVESPAKAKTIEKFLGKDFRVVASYGHVRDLPKSKLGVDVEHDFEPEYIIPKGTAKNLNLLKSAFKQADTLYLATDYDREGEAIAWHIIQAAPPTKKQKVQRITFTEITKSAIQAALASPRQIDQNLVDAQQARRVLDRLVGYSLSPLLWKKVRRGLSAGRVQSVALKLLVDREREIEAFKPDEYWSLEAELSNQAKLQVTAALTKIGGKKAELTKQAEVTKITKDLEQAAFTVASLDSKEVKRSPAPPFITSSLQQEASRRFSFGAKRTMTIAQQLYEAGHISYMRTDSYTLSSQALDQARKLIKQRYGPEFVPESPRVYKKKVRGAQEAHEAIRPTDLTLLPSQLSATPEQKKLYEIIWKRTMASQMADARYLQQGIDIAAMPTGRQAGSYTFRATGRRTLFEGFTKVYIESQDNQTEETDRALPELKEGEKLKLEQLLPEQHFTSPPPRYTEASLIKKLEENGIGRPSTYAPTISTLISRGYTVIENRQLLPQLIGFMVTDLLSEHFPFVVSEEFTAEMEDKFDDIAEGQIGWRPVIKEFYDPLQQLVSAKTDAIARVKMPERPTDEKCPVCGKPMVIKTGRFGEFMACTGWPDCKTTKAIVKTIGVKCPEDGGEIVEKRTRRGKTFYGCSNYPNCKYASWQKPAAEPAAA